MYSPPPDAALRLVELDQPAQVAPPARRLCPESWLRWNRQPASATDGACAKQTCASPLFVADAPSRERFFTAPLSFDVNVHFVQPLRIDIGASMFSSCFDFARDHAAPTTDCVAV